MDLNRIVSLIMKKKSLHLLGHVMSIVPPSFVSLNLIKAVDVDIRIGQKLHSFKLNDLSQTKHFLPTNSADLGH